MVRVFASEEAGLAYPSTLESTIAGCPSYSVNFDDSFWETDVTATTLDSATIVADSGATLVGWSELNDDWAVEVVDLQYGNIAIRTVFNHQVGQGPTPEQFAAFLTSTAAAMKAAG